MGIPPHLFAALPLGQPYAHPHYNGTLMDCENPRSRSPFPPAPSTGFW
jgi:hypothetical protein